MAIDRRSFLIGGGLAALCPKLGLAQPVCPQGLFVAACREASGTYSAVAYGEGCGLGHRVALPGRGHDLVQRPGTGECVVFARRPGTFAVTFRIDGSATPAEFQTRADRHFYGHGAFSPDGRLLYTSENDFDAARGVIGVRDAAAGYRQIGEFDSGGLEPHDICLLGDGRTLVAANGGIETHPSSERENLNIADMNSSLSYIDLKTGDVLEVHRLPPSLHKLSIRHLALAHDNTVFLGCQYEGPAAEHPALVGFHRRGDPLHLIEAAGGTYRPMQNYIGSVSADASGEFIAATSPRGGRALIIDARTRRIISQTRLADVCGVAPRHTGASFLLASGSGDIGSWSPAASADASLPTTHENVAWDNHMIRIG
ncbi:MAG: DUF1513 domain-containing protein [Hyphomicrobiaceae bacterium]